MGTQKTVKKEFPSVLDSAYEQYKRDLKRHKLVEEIMSKNVVTIAPEDKMAKAVSVMGEKHIGSLIVIKYETPVGIVTERDLLSKVLLKEKSLQKETVENCMSFPLVTVCYNTKIKEAAKLMIEKKGRLAVFECGNLLGIVTAADLIKTLPQVEESEVKVDDFMSKPVITTDETNSIHDVAKTMGKQRVGSVIITRNGKPIGIFTERDLLTSFLGKEKSLDVNVGGKCSSRLVTAPAGSSIHKAAATMALKHIRRLPIVEEGEIIGIVTARDIVEAYTR